MWYVLIIIAFLLSQIVIAGAAFLDEVSILILGVYLIYRRFIIVRG